MKDEKKKVRNPSLYASFYLIIFIWVIFGVEQLFHIDFSSFGILPRESVGLYGILLAPFLHANLTHILYNTIPLFVLSFILALLKPKGGIWIWFVLDLTTGLLVWLFARGGAYHIGASGVIFALLGFIITYGIYRRSFGAILAAVIIAGIYGSLVFHIIPSDMHVSWESHLFGFLAGIFWGYIWGKSDRKKVKSDAISDIDNAT